MNYTMKQYQWITPENAVTAAGLGSNVGRQFDTVTVMGALMPVTPPV
jgi:hypothetical protein